MRFLKRDLTRFSLYKPRFTQDSDGDGHNVYDGPPADEFQGNVQPFGEKSNPEAYGIDFKYAYIVYAPLNVGFKEMDRIFDGIVWYEIKVIQRWKIHYRLLVEEVHQNE